VIPTVVWIVGRGGLLGSQIERVLAQEIPGAVAWVPRDGKLSWHDPDRLATQLGAAVDELWPAVRDLEANWMVLWCAGAGGVGTPWPALLQERAALRTLLRLLRQDPAGPRRSSGVFLYCSSAGGVYGRSDELPLTEESPGSPISEYGRNRLAEEEEVLRWGAESPVVSCLVARISNLYGPEQRLGSTQGLIGRLSQHHVHRRPLNIYVPLDTLRDHLHVEDAARYLLRCLRRLQQADRPGSVVKIFAAERSVSIAGLVGIFTRVTKQRPRIIFVSHRVTRQQPGRLLFRSRIWTDLAPRGIDLAAGVCEVYQHHLSLLQLGKLPAPPQL
jgi:UDP-glucose 4-epimerase